MLEKLKDLIINEDWSEARNVADYLYQNGEKSDVFWILNATIYQMEGFWEEEYSCILEGLYTNPRNYELYFMLGNYYMCRNINQAFLCYEQAYYYCMDENDKGIIAERLEETRKQRGCDVVPVSIVIVQSQQSEALSHCLKSIREYNSMNAYQIVVVGKENQGGDKGYLESREDIKFVDSNATNGFAERCNLGIKMSMPNNDIFILDEDILLFENALFWLRMALYERPTVGAVGPLTNTAEITPFITENFKMPEKCFDVVHQMHLPQKNPYENKLWLKGNSILIKREALDNMGLLDTRYAEGVSIANESMFSVMDYGLRLTKNNYELLLCYNSIVYYDESITVKEKLTGRSCYAKNENRFMDKWKTNIFYYANARMDLIEMMDSPYDKEIRVLEIGCGCGATLSAIRAQYSKAKVYGVEIEDEVAEFGTYMADIIVGNIEDMELPYEYETFDYILFGDVLEHLRKPEKTLARLKKYLRPEGKIIASIPNLMNISIIVSLLKGYFPYQESGLLDRTHIHMFTFNEIVKMFVENGFEINQVRARCLRERFPCFSDEDEKLIQDIYKLEGIADT